MVKLLLILITVCAVKCMQMAGVPLLVCSLCLGWFCILEAWLHPSDLSEQNLT